MELKSAVDAISVSIDDDELVTVRPTAGYNIGLEDIQSTFFWAVKEQKRSRSN